MIDKRVLFIGEKTSFIVKSINDGLMEAGFSCEYVKQDVSEISRLEDKPSLLFLYVSDFSTVDNEVLVYIRDLCMEEEKMLFLVGYKQDLLEIKAMMPIQIIGGMFERPINARAIGEELNRIVNREESKMKKKQVLVVDDSGTMLRTIKEWLSDKYRVSMANSAASAISFLATNIPDMILLDYEMPVCSGPQMLQMIRSEVRTESIPVMFLTSKGDKESVRSVLALKPNGYMLKTMPPEKILETIDNYFLSVKAKELSK